MATASIKPGNLITDDLMGRLFPQKLRDELGSIGATPIQINALKIQIATAYLEGVIFGLSRTEAPATPTEKDGDH